MASTVWLNDKFCYAPIHKNASTWARNYFSKNFLFTEHHLEIEEVRNINKNYIVFLRNPIDRWISGSAQWFHSKRDLYPNILTDNYKIDHITFEMLTDKIAIDGHTDLQLDFLHYIIKDRTFFFNISDPKFEKNFFDFVSRKMYYSNTVNFLDNRNHSDPSTFKMNIIKQLRLQLKDKKYLKKIEKYYMKDFDYIANCNFYQHKESGL